MVSGCWRSVPVEVTIQVLGWSTIKSSGASGCTGPTNCPGTQDCQTTVTFTNLIISEATRVCTDSCTEAITPSSSPFTICATGTNAPIDLRGKTLLQCFSCTGTKTSACAAAQVPASSPKVGGWSAFPSTACTSCWTKVTWAGYDVAATGDVVERGCTNNVNSAPTDNYDSGTGAGDKVAIFTGATGDLCNSAAADVTSLTTSTTTTAAPTPAPTPAPTTAATTAPTTVAPGRPAGATTTAAAATTTVAVGGGSGASTIAPATFAMFFISMIIMKMFD